MKPLIVTLLLLAAVHRGSCEVDVYESEPLDKPFAAEIKQLKLSPENLAGIHWWDGKIVTAFTKTPNWTYCYFSAHDLTLRKLTVPGLDTLVDVWEWQGHPCALGKIGKFYAPVLKLGGKWTQIRLPDSIDIGLPPEFIPSTRSVAFFARGSLFLYEEGKWRRVKLPPVPKSFAYDPFPAFYAPGDESQLYGTQFFTGWDMMRYGGILCMFDIAHPEKGWKKYTADTIEHDPKALMDRVGVTAMAVDSRGRLWISQGDDEVISRGLYRYDGSTWTTLIRGTYHKDSGPVVLGGYTDIMDVTCGPDNKVYILADDLGIYTWNGNTPSRVIGFNFGGFSTFKTDPHAGRSQIPCYPRELVRDDSGNFFVSTANDGILCFIRDGGRYHLRQIVAPEYLQ